MTVRPLLNVVGDCIHLSRASLAVRRKGSLILLDPPETTTVCNVVMLLAIQIQLYYLTFLSMSIFLHPLVFACFEHAQKMGHLVD